MCETSIVNISRENTILTHDFFLKQNFNPQLELIFFYRTPQLKIKLMLMDMDPKELYPSLIIVSLLILQYTQGGIKPINKKHLHIGISQTFT